MPEIPGTPPKALFDALTRLLRPLVRLLLDHQISYPVLCKLLKNIYVDIAEHDLAIGEQRQTDSRITLLTGVHRKDVRRIRQEAHAEASPPESATLGAELVSRWIGLAEYLNDDGRARPLPRLTRGTEKVSFESLVESVSKDIRPRAVLDEWLRLGVAHVDEDDLVWLNTAAFIPEKGFEEKAYYFGNNLRDHIAACAHNLSGATPPFFERSVFYEKLSEEDIEELARLSNELGMTALQTMNRRALEMQKKSGDLPDATKRINFGVYFFHTHDESSVAKETDDDGDTQ